MRSSIAIIKLLRENIINVSKSKWVFGFLKRFNSIKELTINNFALQQNPFEFVPMSPFQYYVYMDIAFTVELYEKGYGKDAAGIAMEAINYARTSKIDVVLVDTAGRMQVCYFNWFQETFWTQILRFFPIYLWEVVRPAVKWIRN